jgi:hypothetical protein
VTFDWWVKRKTKQANEFTIRKNNYRSFLIDCSFVDCFIHVRCSATPAPWLDKLSTESYKETIFVLPLKQIKHYSGLISSMNLLTLTYQLWNRTFTTCFLRSLRLWYNVKPLNNNSEFFKEHLKAEERSVN